MNSSTLKTHVAQSVAWARVGNWMSPLIIEPDQLFICQITWEETELNWSSLKMILRNSQFIFAAAAQKANAKRGAHFNIFIVWLKCDVARLKCRWTRHRNRMRTTTSSWSPVWFSGLQVEAAAAVGILAKRLIAGRLQAFWSRAWATARAACHMTMMWHKLAVREDRSGNCSGLCDLIVFAFATKSQIMRSSSIFTFTVSWV